MQLPQCLFHVQKCIAQWTSSQMRGWRLQLPWIWEALTQSVCSRPALVKYGRRMTAVLSHGTDRRSLASTHLDMLCRMKLLATPLPPCARMEVVVSFVGFKRGARVACVLGRCARCTCSLALLAEMDRSATYARGLLVILLVGLVIVLMDNNRSERTTHTNCTRLQRCARW